MSNQLLASKVVLTEREPQIVSVTSQPTAVLGMVGVTQRGPIGVARQFLDFSSWVKVYGSATADTLDTWLAVQAFFEEGGQYLWFVRTAHYTDITDTSSLTAVKASNTVQTTASLPAVIEGVNAAPFVFSPNDSISISVSGGAADTATFAATQATLSAAAGPYVLSNGGTLQLTIDGGTPQTFTFLAGDFAAIATATAAEVADVLNATLIGATAVNNAGTLEITSDKYGTASGAAATGGTSLAAFTFGGGASGTGDVADITAVTFAEFVTVLEADIADIEVVEQSAGSGIPDIQTTATGAAVTLEITASTNVQSVTNHAPGEVTGSTGTAVNTLRFVAKYDGAYGNNIVARVTDATSGEADRFNLEVVYNGIVAEVFTNLSMDDVDTEGRFIEGVLAAQGVGSELIEAIDLNAAGATQRPANGSYTLVSGADGLTNLSDSDFIGSSVSVTGLRAFDNIAGITILAVPARATAAVHNAMVNYAENQYPAGPGLMLALLEPPEGMNATAIVEYFSTTAGLVGSTEHAATFWPRITVRNPNKIVFGNTETVVSTVTGHVAGIMARTDSSQPGGVHIPAAGLTYGQVQSAQGYEPDPDGNARHQVTNPAVRDLVYPKLINPIAPNSGVITIDGTRTLRADSNFPGFNERRTVIFIETQVRNIADTFRHRRNTSTTRRAIERSIEAFLLAQMSLGAFRSDDPAEAFVVDVSDAINPASVQAANQANVRVHLATNKALDWIVIEFAQIFEDVALDSAF